MALFKIFKGNDKSKLDAKALIDGYAYYNTDTTRFYIDAFYPPTTEQQTIIENYSGPKTEIVKYDGLTIDYTNSNNPLILDRRPINDDAIVSVSVGYKENTETNEETLGYKFTHINGDEGFVPAVFPMEIGSKGQVLKVNNETKPTWSSSPFHTALTSKGTTVTATAGETYGIAGVATGSATTIYSKWYVNLDSEVTTPYNGMIIQIKIPVAGVNAGCAITIDKGSNFYPVSINDNDRVTTHFSVNDTITLQFDSARAIATYGKQDGSTNGNATINITGCWRLLNTYDNNTTYSDMSVAEMRTGTKTTSRVMTAKNLKDFLATLDGTGLILTHSSSSPYFQLNHSNSVTAKTSYADTATIANANGGTIKVTDIKYDSEGHITGSQDRTITLSQTTYTLAGLMGNTSIGGASTPIYWTGNKFDTINSYKVDQNNLTSNGAYRILLSYSTNDENETNIVNKSVNLTFNPSTKLLFVGGSITATGNLTITGNTNLNNETYANSLTTGSLLVTGNTNFTQIPTAPTPTNSSNDTSIATTAFVKNAFIANDAMIYKGTLDGGNSLENTTYTPAAQAGWTYKVATAGYINGVEVEVGDTFICSEDDTVTATSANINDIKSKWNILQTNIDGTVIGPTESASGIAVFTGTTGKAIRDSGKQFTATTSSFETSYDDNTIPTTEAVYNTIKDHIADRAKAAYLNNTASITGSVAYYSDTSGTFASDENLNWDSEKQIFTAAKLNGYVIAGQKAESTLGEKATAEGIDTIASGTAAHAEGCGKDYSGYYIRQQVMKTSPYQITNTTAYYAFPGLGSRATGESAHAEGSNVLASGFASHAEGSSIVATSSSMMYAGSQYITNYTYIFKEVVASGTAAHAEGVGTTASNVASHAEGNQTEASEKAAHAEGYCTKASGPYSHAEGGNTEASGQYSHAEGGNTKASGQYSHAEGYYVEAPGQYSHAEGYRTKASGQYSHAEGNSTTASGTYSHAEGYSTIANHAYQHVFGVFNIADSSTSAAYDKGNYIEIVGNGTSSTTCSNARTLDWDGNEEIAGGLITHNNITAPTTAYIKAGTFQIGGSGETITNKIKSSSTFYIDRPAKYSVIFAYDGANKIWIDQPDNNFRPDTTNSLNIGTKTYAWKSIFISTNPTTDNGLAFSNGSTVLGRIGVNSSGGMALSVPNGQGIHLRPHPTDTNLDFIVNKNEVQLLNIPKINLTDNSDGTKSASIVFNSTTNALDFVFA